MKKFLLLSMAMMAVSAGSFAQQKQKDIQKSFISERPLVLKDAQLSKVREKGPKRAVENGVYYMRPFGSLYGALTEKWSYSYFPFLYVGANTPVWFINQSSTATTWMLNGQEVNDVDENNNYLFGGEEEGLFDADWYYVPVLTDGKTEFFWGEDADGVGETVTLSGGSYLIEPYVVLTDEPAWMSLCSAHNTNMYSGINTSDGYRGYAYGTIDFTDYLIDAFPGHKKILMNGVYQVYDAPMSPRWFDMAAINFTSNSDTPMAAGSTLSLKVVKVEFDEEGYPTLLEDQVIGEMTAKAEDLVTVPASSGNFYTAIFKNEETDKFGNKSNKPIVVDSDYAIIIEGFQNKGIDVGIWCTSQFDYDNDFSTKWILTEEDGTAIDNPYGWGGLNAMISVHAIHDGVKVLTQETYEYTDGSLEDVENLDYLMIGDDMNTFNMGDNDINYAMVKTIMPYFDEGGADNYFFDLPDWLELTDDEVSEITTNYNGQEYVYAYGLAFTALSDVEEGETVNGKKGRFAEIKIEGKGVVSEPIYVLQGDITIEDVKAAIAAGIENVTVAKADNQGKAKVYNLSGQQVNGSYKGIVIKNGKKVIKK